MNRVPLALAVPLLIFGCGQDGVADDREAGPGRSAVQANPDAEDLLRNAAEPGDGAEAEGAGR